jgi:chemotaxis protein CheX
MTEIAQSQAGALILPPVLDLVAAADLLAAFQNHRGHPLEVDGSDVQRLGAQCLQVLLAAQAAWAADNQTFLLGNFSDEFRATLELLGVTPQALTYRKELAS